MASTPSKWAVLVGVDFYVRPEMGLSGSVNDIEDIYSWLKETQHPIDITKFLSIKIDDTQKSLPGSSSEWPTYDNVTRKLMEIGDVARPGDFVYFHFSGHGALKSTMTGEYRANDHSDAALVLFDEENDVRYLRGIDLAHIFDHMVSKNLKLIVVLDCCNAGSITRKEVEHSAYNHIRGFPWNLATATASPVVLTRYPNADKSVCRNATTNQHWLLSPDGYVLIAACGPHEIAGECRGEDGKIHGALSYFLLKALVFTLTTDFTANIGSIYRQLRAMLHIPFPEQHPVLFGNEFSTFMGTIATEEKKQPVFSIVKASGIDQIWLNAGYAHGLCLDDEFVLSPVESQIADVLINPTNLNKVRVTAVHAFQCETELIHSPLHRSSISAGWSAILVGRSRPIAQIELFEGADDDWKEALNRNIWLQTVHHGQFSLTFPAIRVEIDETENYIFRNSSGQKIEYLPPISCSNTHAMNHVIAVLEHLAKFAYIKNLESRPDNDLPDSHFSIELKAMNDLENGLTNARLEIEHKGKLSVIFKNKTDKPLNLTVLNLRPRREITTLYPSRSLGEWKVIQPKMTRNGIEFAGEDSFVVTMSIPDLLRKQGCLEVEDFFKFFVTTRPSSFAALELPELDEQVWRPRRGSESLMLSNFLQGLNVGRMISLVQRDESDKSEQKWACYNFAIKTKL